MPEQKNSTEKKREVGEPNTGGWREASLARERHSDQRDRIVQEDQQDGQDKSAGLAAFLRREAERNADQSQDDACGRQREAAMIFDQVPAAGDGVAGLRATEQVRNFHLTEGRGFVLLTIL